MNWCPDVINASFASSPNRTGGAKRKPEAVATKVVGWGKGDEFEAVCAQRAPTRRADLSIGHFVNPDGAGRWRDDWCTSILGDKSLTSG